MDHAIHPYCKVCCLVVAPQDPERVQVGHEVYHEHCLRKQERNQERKETERLRKLYALQPRYA